MIYRLPFLNTCDIIISYCVILQLFVALIAEPIDHLIPPTDHLIPPTHPSKALPHRAINADHSYSYNTIKSKPPLRIPVQDAHKYLHQNHRHHHPYPYAQQQQQLQQQQHQRQPSSQIPSAQRVNFMTRIARWLGFSETPYEQKISHGNYAYAQQHHNQTLSSNSYDKKASCNLCNKYPWVPLFSTAQESWNQEQLTQQHLPAPSYKHIVTYTPKPPKKFQQQQQQFPLKQRALQFNYSGVRPQAPPQGAITNINNFVPMPVTNLRSHNQHNQFAHQQNVPLVPLTIQELPSIESSSSSSFYSESVGAHSELQSNRVRSTNHPTTIHYHNPINNNNNNNNNNHEVEFIKSHQLTDFVTSVEYPATFVESHTIDLLKSDKNTNAEGNDSGVKSIDTVMYKLNDLNSDIHKYVPASHLLTEHHGTTFITSDPETTNKNNNNNNNDDLTTSFPSTKQTTSLNTLYNLPSHQHHQSQTPLPFPRYYEADNYPSASSQQQLQEFDTHKIHYEAWQALQNEYYDRKNTQNPPIQIPMSIPTTPLSTHSHTPSTDQLSYVETSGNEKSPYSKEKVIENHMASEIPKQSFDLSNNYDLGDNKNAPPRPFTLNIAVPNNYVHENQVTPLPSSGNQQESLHETSTTTPASTTNEAKDLTSPTKTKMHQVVIPYKRKHKPRPFQPTQPLIYNGHSGSNSNYRATSDIEQQESKVVSLAAEHPPTNHVSRERQSSKILTKILASNLRELLKHEREMKQTTKTSSFDLIKLRRNIDGWTEQEYTSLSHRPSTPMIRGRSKHIPSEYLSTTTLKTSIADLDSRLPPNVSELSTSINNLEPLLISDEQRASNRYVSHINDNSLLDYFDEAINHHRMHSTTSTLSTPTTALKKLAKSVTLLESDSNTPTHVYHVSPSELWKKAKVAVTADTKESVYVVTPQPRLLSKGSPLTSKTEVEDDSDLDQHSSSKSSRFLLPKSPKNDSNELKHEINERSTTDTTLSTPKTTTALYSPDYFGLVGLSSYVPADPVEIIDGNSKVNY